MSIDSIDSIDRTVVIDVPSSVVGRAARGGHSRARDGVVDGVVVRGGGGGGGATTSWDDDVDGGVDGDEARRGGDCDARASRGARRWGARAGDVGEATETAASGGGGVRGRDDDERVRAQWRVVVRA
jgi:hypothetical protein